MDMWYIFMFPTSGQIGSGYTSGVSHEWILKAYLSTNLSYLYPTIFIIKLHLNDPNSSFSRPPIRYTNLMNIHYSLLSQSQLMLDILIIHFGRHERHHCETWRSIYYYLNNPRGRNIYFEIIFILESIYSNQK